MLMTITNLHQKTFQQGWGGTCHQKSVNHTNVRPQIKDYTKNNLEKLSKLDMFLLFFPFVVRHVGLFHGVEKRCDEKSVDRNLRLGRLNLV